MGINRTVVVIGLLAILSACATSPRPDAEDSTSPRRVPTAPTAPSPDPDSRPVERAPVVKEPAPVVEPIAPPATPTPIDEPIAAPSAEPAEAPVQTPKRVKPIKPVEPAPAETVKPVQRKPPVSTPQAPPKPAPVVAPSPPEAIKAIEEAPVSDASAMRIQGKLELSAGNGQSLSAIEKSQAVVYFVSDSSAARPKPGHYRIYTHNKEFEPASLVIPLGSTISFPNQDEILHNVFSVTPRSSFDLGIYGEGKSADYTFKKSGLVLINCNVHQAMQANVLVVDTASIVSPDAQGRFKLDNLPAGSGKLMVWHPRGNVQEQSVTVPMAQPVTLRMSLTKPRITEHLNKEHKAYR